MRKNIFSAITQTGASLSIAFLSIAIFRFLTPDQVAFLRQHYFVPFALIAAFSPANQNYLRSLLFSDLPSTDLRRDMNSLALMQLMTAALLLTTIILSLNASGTDVTWLNVVALTVALILVLVRTIITGVLEFRGNYSTSIILNNLSSAIPYIAAFSIVLLSELNSFFVSTIILNTLGIMIIIFIGLKLSARAILQLVAWKWTNFRFNFHRYFGLSLISLGSVVIYQGVEFSLYNHTAYSNTEIANYGLAFSISAIMRQIILTAIQPLERERSSSVIRIPFLGEILRPVAIEILIYVILIAAALILPTLVKFVFPNFGTATAFIPALIFGVLGSAIQQVYSVRMIALARTGFLGGTQVFLALSSILAVVLLHSSLSMVHMIWLTSIFIWLRGCIIIPLYAEYYEKNFSLKLWMTRVTLSVCIFIY